MDMEIQLFPKKVFINTLSSALIDHSSHILPQWIAQSHINYVSAYQFATYNVEQQSTKIIPREQGQSEVMCVQFKAQMNQINCIMHYIYRQDSNFYLVDLPSRQSKSKILIYRNEKEQRQQIVQEFIDYLMNEQKIESKASIISRAQKIIQGINQQEIEEEQNKYNIMSHVQQMIIVYQCNYALIVVQMGIRSGLMLVNLTKTQPVQSNQFYCPIRSITQRATTISSNKFEQPQTARIIYLFEDTLLSLHKTKDLTKFILHTTRHIMLIKINYQTMDITILHKIESTHKDQYISVGVGYSGDDEVVMAMCQVAKVTTFQKLEITAKKQIKMFVIGEKKLFEIKTGKNDSKLLEYQSSKTVVIDEDGEQQKQLGNVKFCTNVIESRYESQQPPEQQSPEDLNRGILMKVFNQVISTKQQIQKQNIYQKQKSLKKIGDSQTTNSIQQSQMMKANHIKDIGGFTCNQNIILIWQKNEAVVHVCKIVSAKEQQQKYKTKLQQKKNKRSSELQKEDQLKAVYTQLMGKRLQQKKEQKTNFQTIIEYQRKIELGFSNKSIKNMILSPSNTNVLIISGNGNRKSMIGNQQLVKFDIFQIDLFRQLGNQDPSIFFKPFKNIFMPKPIQNITTSFIKQSTFFLTGNLVHSLDNQLIDGALSFDVHPYNIFLAVSFGFTAKVYALQGNQKLTTLYAMNGQGMKQVKYSPLGNHLCILFSKCIKIIDSYSFTTMYVINQKNTNFLKCFYSSNGQQFYSLNENHQFVFYNTFDYIKIDTVKPSTQTNEFKPISIKSFLKHSMYCFVLQNGNLFVKYKNNAIVVFSQQFLSYNDGQLINCIEIDQKNGILFTGCRSGLVRSHLWPDRQNNFDNYTQIRTSFSQITYLALSNTSPFLYIGHQNGNISKTKYVVQRQKNYELQNERSAMLSDRNPRYLNLQNFNTIEKMYKYVLQNGGFIAEDLPEKLKLEYKLTEVIQKLNDEMKKLKCNIHQELQEKAKISVEKVDIGLLHHINQMITTKLYSQLREQIESNNKQLQELKNKQTIQLKEIFITQNQLIKQKCFKISDFTTMKNSMKQKFDIEIEKQMREYNAKLNVFQGQVLSAKKTMQCKEDKLFFLPNDYIEQYQDESVKLDRQLQHENKRHFQLIKSCAYTETAMKDLKAKRIKQETKQIKIQLQKDEIKLNLDKKIELMAKLKQQIKDTELKLHKVQNKSAIIKGNAQFKRVANIQEMNDACSYKLLMKNKLENQIADLIESLIQIEELFTNKGNNVADQITVKNTTTNTIRNKHEQIGQYKSKLKITKFSLLQTHNKLKTVDPINEYKSLTNSFIYQQSKQTVKSSENFKQKTLITDRGLTTSKSGRFISTNSKNIDSCNKVIDMQTKFLKSNIKAHQKKIKKFENQNGELLFQYGKLKWQARDLKDKQVINRRVLQNTKKDSSFEQSQSLNSLQSTTRMQLSKTPFQKYCQLKTAQNLKLMTATSTPRHFGTNNPYRLCTDRIN